MLSSTNTITDIKEKLGNDYTFYGLASDAAFTSALTRSVDNIVRTEMYPSLAHLRSSSNFVSSIGPVYLSNVLDTGKAIYDDISSKDKTGLTVTEEYIYWAEVFYAMSDFLDSKDKDTKYSRNGDSHSVSTKGYSSSVSGRIDVTGKSDISRGYYSDAETLMTLAGCVKNSLHRGGR